MKTMKTRPSEHCFDNCKPYELKLKKELNITKKMKLIDLIHVKLLRMKQNYYSICVKK